MRDWRFRTWVNIGVAVFLLVVIGGIGYAVIHEMNIHYRSEAVTIETVISDKQFYPAHWETRTESKCTARDEDGNCTHTLITSKQVWVKDSWAVWWAEMPCGAKVSQNVDKAYYDSVKVGDEVSYKTHWVKCTKNE